MVHKIWIFKEKHVFILYYFVLIKAGKGLSEEGLRITDNYVSACLHTSYVSATLKSFVEMTKFILSQLDSPGLFLLSERISQDPRKLFWGREVATQI